MQQWSDQSDPELLALAAATLRVAATIPDAGVRSRLQEIAEEVRQLAANRLTA